MVRGNTLTCCRACERHDPDIKWVVYPAKMATHNMQSGNLSDGPSATGNKLLDCLPPDVLERYFGDSLKIDVRPKGEV